MSYCEARFLTNEEAIHCLDRIKWDFDHVLKEVSKNPETCIEAGEALRMAITALRREGELLAVLKRVQERNRKMCFIPESESYVVACEVTRIVSMLEQPSQEQEPDDSH